MNSSPGVTRRGFLLGAAGGLAAGGVLGYLGHPFVTPLLHQPAAPRLEPPVHYAMPGPYPGRVVEVRDEASVRANGSIDPDVVRKMVHEGVARLVHGDPTDPASAWKRFFANDDVVGIKVNPVGRGPKPGEGGRVANAVGVISNPAILVATVEGLEMAGVPRRNIIVFERYADEFADAGYADLMLSRPLQGVRWYASAVRYHKTQMDIEGFDLGRNECSPELARRVAGYDPDVFAHMGFCSAEHSTRDDRRFRSHLSMIVSRMVNKFITIPCLKDHRSAGVTLALKNMSHGMNNNVARSHVSGVAHGVNEGVGTVIGPNQCNTFIPQAVAQHRMREKATLHILDGLIGVYEGGPGCWNKTWGTWPYKGLFFATDPVAMDHVGWTIIDAKRRSLGWRAVADMGLSNHNNTPCKVASEMPPLGAANPLEAATLALATTNIREGRASEVFDLRTPQHVVLAGNLGLGTFDRAGIDHLRLIHSVTH